MKVFVLACLVALALARPQELLDSSAPAPAAATLEDAGILRLENEQNEDGSFSYGFETANNIIQQVSGQLRQIGEESGIVMQGSYSFVAKDENGQDVPVEIRWTADENGFQPEGDAIPRAPDSAGADIGAVQISE